MKITSFVLSLIASLILLTIFACDKTENANSLSQQQSSQQSPTSHQDSKIASQPKISLKGKAFWKMSEVSSYGATGSDFYHIELSIKNIGQVPLNFDIAEGSFTGKRGAELQQKAYNIERQESGNKHTTDFKVGEEKVFEYSTKSYDFLHFEGGEVRLTLLLASNVVAGPFKATLPRLHDLPLDYVRMSKDRAGREKSDVYLEFRDTNGSLVK